MSFSPQFLDEVRARTLLSALIGRTVKLTRAGREWKACCPFHNEKSPSFTVNDDKGFYHCFGCSAHGDAIRWLTDQRGLPFVDAVKALADAAGLEMPAEEPQARRQREEQTSLHAVMAAACEWFAEQLHAAEGTDAGGAAAARAYVRERGLTRETVEGFALGYAPDRRDALKTALARFGEPALIAAGLLIFVEGKPSYDRFRGRLMIPIRDARGRVIAFGGRLLGAGEPKYLNSPETPLFDKGRTLWNLDRAAPAARSAGRLIVVEGYMDAIALAQAGIAEVVAPLGTALTEHHLERLWRQVDRPILCLDGDAAGRRAAIRAAQRALPLLTPGKTLDFIALPSGLDPDDLVQRQGAAAMEALLARPMAMVDLLWQTALVETNVASPDARAKLQADLQALSGRVADPIIAAEYQRSFRGYFWDRFGWKKPVRDGVREAMALTRGLVSLSLTDKVIRAMLLGLGRYPRILLHDLEAIEMLPIENRHLSRWRAILATAAAEHPDLDCDLIDTILRESDVSPIERWDISRDLGFSFSRPGSDVDRAEAELSEVIGAILADHELALALNAFTGRLADQIEGEDWAEYQRLLAERQQVRDRLVAVSARMDEVEEAQVDLF